MSELLSFKKQIAQKLLSDIDNLQIDIKSARHIAQLILRYFSQDFTDTQFLRAKAYLMSQDNLLKSFITRHNI